MDDGISDPELIMAKYLIGRSAYFEVQLTLAEFADSITSASGGVVGDPNLVASLGLEGPFGGNCPREDQYVWVEGLKTIKAKDLLKNIGKIKLYNPITKNSNLLIGARLVKDRPLFRLTTARGAESIVSQTHKVIRNTADIYGTFISKISIKQEVLSFIAHGKSKQKLYNIYSDELDQKADVGIGNVVEIELESEFIYATGHSLTKAIVAHNRKPIDEDIPF